MTDTPSKDLPDAPRSAVGPPSATPAAATPGLEAEDRATPECVIEMIHATIGSLHPPLRPVLRAVSWRVTRGDFWAVGGLEGSGKSALLATAAGLMRPLEGKVRLFGHDLSGGFTTEALAQRLRVGLVFGGGRLLRHLTVAQNVALPLRYHRDASLSGSEIDRRVQALLDWAGLEDVADQYPAGLGRRREQRAGLARALALKPEVLLVDNPLSGLDPRDAGWWLDTLEDLVAGHAVLDGAAVTLVVAADDLRPWRRRARQFACLHEQRFLPIASPPENALAQDEWLMALLGPHERGRSE